jgi:hypothetical protein
VARLGIDKEQDPAIGLEHRADPPRPPFLGAHRFLVEPEREVVAAAIAERPARRMEVTDDAADQDHVVAGVDPVMHRAVEPRDRRVEHGGALMSRRPGDLVELVRALRREDVGDLAMVLGEDVDAEMRSRGKDAVALGAVGDANQDQGRVERDRGKGIGGEAPWLPIVIDRRDDRHTGNETAQRLAEFPRIKRLVGHPVISRSDIPVTTTNYPHSAADGERCLEALE